MESALYTVIICRMVKIAADKFFCLSVMSVIHVCTNKVHYLARHCFGMYAMSQLSKNISQKWCILRTYNSSLIGNYTKSIE